MQRYGSPSPKARCECPPAVRVRFYAAPKRSSMSHVTEVPVRSPRRESDGSERRPWGAGNSLFRDVCGVTQVGWLSRITDSCVRVWSTLPYLCYIPISLNEQVGCIDAIQCCVTILNEIISSTWTSLELSSQHLKGKISKII